jgi:hypothetical protein
MTEIYSSDQITVLGGPSKISVDLDIGPTGKRGSYWFVGNGFPNTAELSPNLLDMYINVDPQDESYLFLYQYQNADGINSWRQILKIIPNFTSKTVVSDFVNGNAQIIVPLISIVPEDLVATITIDKINIQKSIVNELPIITTIKSLEIITDNQVRALKIVVNALELNLDMWVEVVGQKAVDLLISVV